MEGTGLIPGLGFRHFCWRITFLSGPPDGTIVGISRMVIDITERKLAENESSRPTGSWGFSPGKPREKHTWSPSWP